MPRLLLAVLLSLGSSGPEQTDLPISIARIETADAKPSNPEFAITLENRGDSDLVVLLGAVVGRKLYPHAISLLLTDPTGVFPTCGIEDLCGSVAASTLTSSACQATQPTFSG